MEHVSMLAEQPFTDAPRCTDPLLAELARMVNDCIAAEARSSLTGLAPRLAAIPRTGRSSAPAIVVAALDTALGVLPGRRDLLRHRRRALRMAGADLTPGLAEASLAAFYRHGPARHALSCAVRVASELVDATAGRDLVLATMLREAMVAAGDFA